MILDTKNKRLDNVNLTEMEFRFISALANNRLVKYEDMFKFIFDFENPSKSKMKMYFSNLRIRLLKKINLNIETRYNLGYILRDTIEVQ